MLWNKLGVSLLVWTHTEVDASGLSYYGEASLYYFSIAGKFECRVPIGKNLISFFIFIYT